MGNVVRYRQQPKHRRQKRQDGGWPGRILGALAIGAVVAGVGYSFIGIPTVCDIKGNISVNTGERIYHVPGQEYYWQTRIDFLKGERWFCSEADALAAGWRKARSSSGPLPRVIRP